MYKKIIFSIFLVLLLSGCTKQMDKLDDGVYHYKNDSLGLTLDLPAEFIYYQTQVKNAIKINDNGQAEQSTDWQDLEIFVPIQEAEYPQEVSGYGKPVLLRVYKKEAYVEQGGFQKIAESGDRVYAIMFWERVPTDWQEKWNDEIKARIVNSFRVK